jgi:hypothetical protein
MQIAMDMASQYFETSEVSAAVQLKILFFWDMTEALSTLEDEGITLPGPDYPLKQRHAHKNVIHVVICNNSLF